VIVATVCTLRVLKAFTKPDGTTVAEGSIIKVPCDQIEELLESNTVALIRVTSTGDEQS